MSLDFSDENKDIDFQWWEWEGIQLHKDKSKYLRCSNMTSLAIHFKSKHFKSKPNRY